MMRSAVIQLLMGCLAVLIVSRGVAAQTPATMPDNGRAPLVIFRLLTEEEQSQIRIWTDSAMPNLAKLIKSMSESRTPFKANRLRNAAAARYRSYQQVKDNKSLLELMMKDVRLENEIFGYVVDLDGATPDRRDVLLQQVRDKTRIMVNQFLDGREQRIDKLKAKLESEQQSLDYDRSHAETLVDQRLRHFNIDIPQATSASSDAPTTDSSQ